jgi:hypothetical protein
MRKLAGIVLLLFCAVVLLAQGSTQAQDKKKDYSKSSIVTRMMAFDKNKDGKLTKDEVTDRRLHRLFDRADKNKDGVVTREELEALAAELEAEGGQDGERGGPGGFGKKGGKGGKGGPGGFGGPPRPGQVLPVFIQERLNLSAEQKKQLAELQKDVDARLAKILTAEQKKELEEMREGPGGRGGPGGKGGKGKGKGGPGRGGPPEDR